MVGGFSCFDRFPGACGILLGLWKTGTSWNPRSVVVAPSCRFASKSEVEAVTLIAVCGNPRPYKSSSERFYKDANRLLAQSEEGTELSQRIGISPKEEYERLDRAANEARVRSEHARLALGLIVVLSMDAGYAG
jgi:hypothetical protein